MTLFAARRARFRTYVAQEQTQRPGLSRSAAALKIVLWKLSLVTRTHGTTRVIRRHVLAFVALLHAKLASAPLLSKLAARGMRTARLYAAHGHNLNRSGRLDEAATYWEQALAEDPELIELYEKIAIVHHFYGRLDDVVRVQRRGIAMQDELIRRHEADQLGFRIVHPSFRSVIGHMAELDVFLKQQILMGTLLEELLFLAPDRRAANSTYLAYWLELFPRVISNRRTIAELEPLVPLLRLPFQAWKDFDGEVRYYYSVANAAQRRWESERRAPLLKLTEEHRERGRTALEQLGVPADAWFVGLHVREDRVLSYRNAPIAQYERAIRAVSDAGGWVIRMGDPSMTPLPPLDHVVDYAHSELKSEWMDVFLWAEGRFLIGTHSGPAGVPQTFGKPVLQTNWLIGYPFWYAGDVYLPKLYWSAREERYLTFREALSSPLGMTLLGEEIARAGVAPVSNTPEELEQGVREMLDRVDGRHRETEEERALRERFESIERPWENPIPYGGARIGCDFLRRHADLLGDSP